MKPGTDNQSGHIEMGIPVVIVAVMIGLFTQSLDDPVSWIKFSLYGLSALLLVIGLFMVFRGGGGMGSR